MRPDGAIFGRRGVRAGDQFGGVLAGSFLVRLLGVLPVGALLAVPAASAEPHSILPAATATGIVNAALTTDGEGPTQKAPAKAHYNVVVLGDSLGDGMWAGLYHVLHKDKRFSVIRKSRVATGFVRQDYYDWNEAVRDDVADTKIDIAVVVMGTNDRQTIVSGSDRYALFEPKWREIYEARVDDFTQTLKKSGARIYWVGLPVMRSPGFEQDMETFNSIFEARAKANGVAFIPTHDLAADKDGKYMAYGTDAGGRKRLLRTEDGVHFTMEGYELLAGAVGDRIEADVDGGLIGSAGASADAFSATTGEGTDKVSAPGTPVELKAQIYDVADIRQGRSDDWRWKSAER